MAQFNNNSRYGYAARRIQNAYRAHKFRRNIRNSRYNRYKYRPTKRTTNYGRPYYKKQRYAKMRTVAFRTKLEKALSPPYVVDLSFHNMNINSKITAPTGAANTMNLAAMTTTGTLFHMRGPRMHITRRIPHANTGGRKVFLKGVKILGTLRMNSHLNFGVAQATNTTRGGQYDFSTSVLDGLHVRIMFITTNKYISGIGLTNNALLRYPSSPLISPVKGRVEGDYNRIDSPRIVWSKVYKMSQYNSLINVNEYLEINKMLDRDENGRVQNYHLHCHVVPFGNCSRAPGGMVARWDILGVHDLSIEAYLRQTITSTPPFFGPNSRADF